VDDPRALSILMVEAGLSQEESIFAALAGENLNDQTRKAVSGFEETAKKTRASCESLRKSGGDADQVQHLLADFQHNMGDFQAFLQSHPDVYSKAVRRMSLSNGEGELLINESGSLQTVLSAANLPVAKASKIEARSKQLQDRIAKIKANLPQTAGRGGEMSGDSGPLSALNEESRKATADVRGFLSEQERRGWETAVFNFMLDNHRGEGAAVLFLAWSPDLDSIAAPRDGAYELTTVDAGNPVSVVNLKKGQPLGFRTDGGHTVAFADKQVTALPDTKAAYAWRLRDPAAKGQSNSH
jgi:hypothetical protein